MTRLDEWADAMRDLDHEREAQEAALERLRHEREQAMAMEQLKRSLLKEKPPEMEQHMPFDPEAEIAKLMKMRKLAEKTEQDKRALAQEAQEHAFWQQAIGHEEWNQLESTGWSKVMMAAAAMMSSVSRGTIFQVMTLKRQADPEIHPERFLLYLTRSWQMALANSREDPSQYVVRNLIPGLIAQVAKINFTPKPEQFGSWS